MNNGDRSLPLLCCATAVLTLSLVLSFTRAGAALPICPAGQFKITFDPATGKNVVGCVCGGDGNIAQLYTGGGTGKCLCLSGAGYQPTKPFCVACAAAKFNTATGKLTIGYLQFDGTCTTGTYDCPKGEKVKATLWGFKKNEGPPAIACEPVCKGGAVYNMNATSLADPANCSCPPGTFYLAAKCLKRVNKPPPQFPKRAGERKAQWPAQPAAMAATAVRAAA